MDLPAVKNPILKNKNKISYEVENFIANNFNHVNFANLHSITQK
jgi:hypothetical protein